GCRGGADDELTSTRVPGCDWRHVCEVVASFYRYRWRGRPDTRHGREGPAIPGGERGSVRGVLERFQRRAGGRAVSVLSGRFRPAYIRMRDKQREGSSVAQ